MKRIRRVLEIIAIAVLCLLISMLSAGCGYDRPEVIVITDKYVIGENYYLISGGMKRRTDEEVYKKVKIGGAYVVSESMDKIKTATEYLLKKD